jgi:triacylglycerol esterase/lipase EstA (alpha/beta hydrolase family)
MKEHGYRDVYSAGLEMAPDAPVEPQSVIIYRYYDQVSASFGEGKTESIEQFAQGLSDLILKLKERVCVDEDDVKIFRVYLFGHSMGGLVIRCFIQNPNVGNADEKKLVDKIFTHAAPHNGIEFEIVGKVPGVFSTYTIDNFNRSRMTQYLALSSTHGSTPDRVDTLDGKFDPNRFFCLVGTNAKDYAVAKGWSSRVVGPISDGLVRITNATVSSESNGSKIQAPRAFVHRSHSGYYGIVNSEEGYQNLTRFLFGDVRVDGVLEISDLSLPPENRTSTA